MAINLLSPVTKLPFGKHKGEVLWTLGIQYLCYLQTCGVTPDTKQTIEDACQLFMNKGAYAILRKSKTVQWKVTLKTIVSSKAVAESHCESNEQYEEYVYHIIKPSES